MVSKVKVNLGRNLTDLQIRKYELISLSARVRALRLLRGLSVSGMLERYIDTEGVTDGILSVYYRLGKEFFDECERGNLVSSIVLSSLSYEEVIDVLERLISNLEWNPDEDDLASSRCVSPLMNLRYV